MKEKAKVVVQKLRNEARQHGWRRSHKIRWMIGIGLILILAGLFPRAHYVELSGYSVGSFWSGEEVTAPFSFPLQKDINRYRQEIQKSLEDLYPVFTFDSSAVTTTRKNLTANFPLLLRTVSTVSPMDSLPPAEAMDSIHQFGLTNTEIKALVQFRKSRGFSEIENASGKFLSSLLDTAIIAKELNEDSIRSVKPYFSLVVRGNEEMILPKTRLLSKEEVLNRLDSKLEESLKNPEVVRSALKVVGASIAPMAFYSPQRTEENRLALEGRVLHTDGIVEEGQHIIGKGEIITPGSKAALESLSEARLERGGIGAQIARVIGTISHVAIIILLVVLYLKFIRRKIYNDNAQLLLLSIALLFPAILAFLSIHIRTPFPLEYLILLPVSAMLLTIVFDSRTGFYGTVIASLIVAGIRGNDYSVALACLSAGSFAAYTVRDLRSRSQLFKSIAYIFLGYLIAITSLALERSTPLPDLGMQLLAALGNSLISPVLTLGFLYLVEMIFDTASDLRLNEFENINHPLLRELSMRAPGTYQHTMLVAQLAENAAIGIGANALLAKVGAYFHDIGKLAEPTDFIENQSAEIGNVHDSITPLESARRVRDHVLNGIDLAYAHHLPARIVDFIPMHHGTLRISFFYDRALTLGDSSALIDDKYYRYPGPKPNSKETGIVMLADASEAVARTIATSGSEATPEAIEDGIDKLILARLLDGQLDDTDLTMKELTVIRKVFARLLAGLHHTRVSYPSVDTSEEAAPQHSASTKNANVAL